MDADATNITAPVENLVMMIPGTRTPVGRAAIFGGLGAITAFGIKPSFSFKPDGTPRPWIVTNSGDKEATLFPYWAYILVPGFIFSVLL